MSHILMDGAAKAESSMRSCKHRARGCHGRLGLFLLFSFFGFAAHGAAQSNPQSGNQPTGKIHGIVVRQGTEEPIEGVLIGATPIKGPLTGSQSWRRPIECGHPPEDSAERQNLRKGDRRAGAGFEKW